MIDKGQLTPDEAKNHPNKNLITRALGVNEEIVVEYNEIGIGKGESILICTDGLTNFLDDESIESKIAECSFDEYPQVLINAANEAGGGDNITIVVLSD